MSENEITIVRLRARKADHDQFEKALRGYMDHEYAHPELFHYNSTRFYFMDAPDNPDEEIWICIDRYEDFGFEAYAASLENARETDPETQKHAVATASLLAPGFVPYRERFTEAPKLAVDMPVGNHPG